MFDAMANDDLVGMGIIAGCLLMSAFFSSSETAITTLGTQKAKYLVKTRGGSAKHLDLWLEHPGRVLATILIFNNVVNILASAVATSIATRHFQSQAIGIATGTITFLVLIFGEIVPKSFAKSNYEPTALFSIRVIKVLEWMVRPLTKILSGFADGVVNAFSDEGKDDNNAISEEELEFLVSESDKAGVLSEIKKEIIEGAFDFDETRVREIMTPRTDLTSVSTEESFRTVLDTCLESGHSRIPVYKENIDQVVGVILVKDILGQMANPEADHDNVEITSIMREPIFSPESQSIMDVFKDLKRSKQHLSIIIDEYGGTAGIVTMEDILEEFVGEIQDEHDAEEVKFQEVGDGSYEVSGATSLYEFLDFFKLDEDEVDTEKADTLGGWLMDLASDMPKVGQTVAYASLRMEVIEVDRHRIERVRVTLDPSTPAKDDKSAGG